MLCEGKNAKNLKSVDNTLGEAVDEKEMDVVVMKFLNKCWAKKITLKPNKFQINQELWNLENSNQKVQLMKMEITYASRSGYGYILHQMDEDDSEKSVTNEEDSN